MLVARAGQVVLEGQEVREAREVLSLLLVMVAREAPR